MYQDDVKFWQRRKSVGDIPLIDGAMMSGLGAALTKKKEKKREKKKSAESLVMIHITYHTVRGSTAYSYLG